MVGFAELARCCKDSSALVIFLFDVFSCRRFVFRRILMPFSYRFWSCRFLCVFVCVLFLFAALVETRVDYSTRVHLFFRFARRSPGRPRFSRL